MQPGVVEDDLIPAQEVFELDAADLGHGDLARQQIIVGGHGEDHQSSSTGER